MRTQLVNIIRKRLYSSASGHSNRWIEIMLVNWRKMNAHLQLQSRCILQNGKNDHGLAD